MTNLQLVLTIGIPSLLVLVGIFLNNARFNASDGRFSAIEARLDRMQADLSQFYRDLGRHDAEIGNIKDRLRGA